MILLTLALAVSLAGCEGSQQTLEQDPPPAPPVVSTPAPVRPSPSPAPPPLPPQEPDPVPLEFGEYYYLFGNPANMGIMFLEEGVAINSDGEEMLYEIIDSLISVAADGERESELRIIDEYTLGEQATGMVYIREGGEGFGSMPDLPAGPRVFFTGERYYLDGDTDEVSFLFRYDGEAACFGLEEPEYGVYSIDGNKITITVDGEVRMVLKILDPVTLEDTLTGDKYGLADSFDRELILHEDYFQFGDEAELSLWFRDDHEVDFRSMGLDIATGVYTVDDDEFLITIEVDGEEMELSILSNYLLCFIGQDIDFIRIP